MKIKKVLLFCIILGVITMCACGGKEEAESSDAAEEIPEDTEDAEDTEEDPVVQDLEESADASYEEGEIPLIARTTTSEYPADIGEWIRILKSEHTAYLRITGVSEEQTEVDKALLSYGEDLDLEVAGNGYGIFYYEVCYPEGYPMNSAGIVSPEIESFLIKTDNGFLKTEDISSSSGSFYAGEVFEGTVLFEIPEGEYEIVTYYESEGENVYVYITP